MVYLLIVEKPIQNRIGYYEQQVWQTMRKTLKL